jgi:two-component system chemotaxis sensor kinase CheA
MDDRAKREFDELLAVFRDQSMQILDEMSHDLLALESRGADTEAVTRIRRGAHTIKGDSACIALDGVTSVAHEIESAFDSVLGGERAIDAGSVDLILRALDAIRGAIGGERVNDLDSGTAAELVEQLHSVQNREMVAAFAPSVLNTEDTELKKHETTTSARNDTPSKLRRDYVRVEAAKVDLLLNLAGEMVIARSIISQVGSELERTELKNELVARFTSASAHMGKMVGELQKAVLKMRMVTIDQVFRRFTRPMRELASERGKLIQIDVTGGSTELDRALVDSLYEPLLHLLRNAVDHGIESPEERVAAGKPETGRITMRAYHEGNQIAVEVWDDGRGIDVIDLKQRAVAAGAISQQQADLMPEEEAANLIFLEGLSTAKEITRISGRGIGAGAIRGAIEQLRGSVAIKSQAGVGTCFVLRMPLTLAIIRALLFNASGQLFALPLLAVSEIARARSSDFVRLDGLEHYRLRDRFISLVRPGVVLAFDRRKGGSGAALRSEADQCFIIVLATGDKQYGVVADDIVGEQELVIKPLDSHWVQNDALAGASVLGDGRVALIMDSEIIFRKAVKHERGKGNGRQVYAV